MSSLNSQKVKLQGIGNVIGVISGKGGVGKTFVAANLALVLAKLGYKVGVLDADISCPNIFKLFGVNSKLTLTADNKIIPAEKYGIKIVSMAGLCATEDEAVVWRGPILSKIIQQMLKESQWGQLDVLIVDFPTGTSDASITILQNFFVDGLVVVSTPQELATLDARRAMNAAALLKVPVIGVLENMRGEVFGEGTVSKLAERFRVPFLGSIPMRKQIVGFCDQGTPAVAHSEEIEMIFSRIARFITDKVMVE
ncbi:Mrp/NBP35 family ATP-binding protein [Candidatus Peregrinibacteria bacterium]|nr:Mrp/NBP35 family ATP-binding protein [Candidatus Peregrinibacteria bacterium]